MATDMKFAVNLLPSTTATYNLGSSSLKWNNIYGTLKGNADTSSKIIDAGNNTSELTFAYAKDGLGYNDYTWLAAWNGTELRAVAKSQFAQANHGHDTYLPLTAGSTYPLTGYLNFKCSSYPGDIQARNSSGQLRYEFYSNSGTGAVADTILRVHTNADGSAFKSYTFKTDGSFHAEKVYGAVWNDYAEYRNVSITEPGRVVVQVDNDELILATSRLQRGCEIISDTFGFAIGKTEENKTPLAVSGRVLAYPYEDRKEFKKHIGWPVCSGPNGTVSIMTEEEEEKYPSRIIGTISAVPDYEEWGTGKVKVNGRVWIRIK